VVFLCWRFIRRIHHISSFTVLLNDSNYVHLKHGSSWYVVVMRYVEFISFQPLLRPLSKKKKTSSSTNTTLYLIFILKTFLSIPIVRIEGFDVALDMYRRVWIDIPFTILYVTYFYANKTLVQYDYMIRRTNQCTKSHDFELIF
jgi:hypothetical protein